jgi:hypothetical protein
MRETDDERAVQAAAIAIAAAFGYEWVFESDTTDENYDRAYWMHVAECGLQAAVAYREAVSQ